MGHHYAKFKENPCVGTDASGHFSMEGFSIISRFGFKNAKINFLKKRGLSVVLSN